jgi:hypothetical protein
MPIQNVHTARENVRRHAWAQDLVDGWRQQVDYALGQDRAFFERMIPELTPWPEYGQNCPSCVGRLSAMGETGLYAWDVHDPDRLVCTYCQTEYPNDAYPETGSITAPRMGQTFTFYLNDDERAHPEDRTGTHAYRWVTFPVHTSFSGVLRSKQGRWCFDQVLPLAQLYALTGDSACAERAVWILEIAASRYPHWLFHSYDGTYADAPPADVARSLGAHPRGGRFPHETIISAFTGRHREDDHSVLFNGFWGAGRFGCSGGDGTLLLELTRAYDLLRGAEVLTPEREQRIVDDLILAGCADTECWNEINNKCPPGRALSALVGRLFERPESVRRAVDGFQRLLEKGFHADGFCTESPSYSDMYLTLMRALPDLLDGYSDPPDYQPKDGTRMERFAPYAHFGRYRLALESMVRMLDPNLKYPVIGDTHFGDGLRPIHAEVLCAHYGRRYAGLLERALGRPLSEAGDEYALWHRDPELRVDGATPLPRRTEYFPAWQVGVLRNGDPDGETALYFNASAQGGHRHTDTLGISYVAHGRELVADRGYIWDDPRGAWTKGTLSHNLVAVDGQKQNHPERDASLQLLGRGPGVEIIRAQAQAYAQCSNYERTCALVRRPDGGSYAVDFFRVAGGHTHHYLFHSNGALVDKGADFAPLQGEEETLTEWMEWVAEPRAAQTNGPLRATWSHEDAQLDWHLLSPVQRLLLADAPGWRSCHGSQQNAPPVQQLLAERTSDDAPLTSHYAALMAPYLGTTSPIVDVQQLEGDKTGNALAIVVRLAERTDYVFSAPDCERRSYGPVALAGRFAFLSVDREGAPLSAYLLDGVELSYGEHTWRLARGRTALDVDAIDECSLHLAQPLPEDLPPADVLLANETGYDVEAIDSRSIRVRDYPIEQATGAALLHHMSWNRP